MQHLKLLASSLIASCLVMPTIASAEPVKTTTTPKKHPECEGTKVKTACNNAADVRDLLAGRLVPTTPESTAAGQQTSAAKAQQAVQPAVDATPRAQEPK